MTDVLGRWVASTLVQLADLPLAFLPAGSGRPRTVGPTGIGAPGRAIHGVVPTHLRLRASSRLEPCRGGVCSCSGRLAACGEPGAPSAPPANQGIVQNRAVPVEDVPAH